MKINKHGYWENETAEGHGVDEGLAEGLVDFFITKPHIFDRPIFVVDIGCGTGFYSKYLNNRIHQFYCQGFDGNPNTPQIAGHEFRVVDFAQPVSYIDPFDFSICLEVGEHIPPEYEGHLIQNISHLSKYGAILSWAIPGQGGDGHVNCRSNEYIIERMKLQGFKFEEIETQILRNYAAHYPHTGYWFRDSLMVFEK